MCCVVCVQCALHTSMTIGLLRDGTMGRIAQMQKLRGATIRSGIGHLLRRRVCMMP